MEGGKGEEGVAFLEMQTKANMGRGVKPISMFTVKKIARFFEQQIAFFLISSLAVAKNFL